ncbi:MAG: pro-sigmaK processing inhibitor BofA family protein [Lachnospiraceae bacterium]|nr:pro-sigmaK processing inhibitor BofA family protein [Lachnospiraceae bacterium]
MWFQMGSKYIIGVTCMLMVILCLKKGKYIWKLLTRASVGSVFIYGGNTLCIYMGLPVLVGLNPFSLICAALLGVPGILVLYLALLVF